MNRAPSSASFPRCLPARYLRAALRCAGLLCQRESHNPNPAPRPPSRAVASPAGSPHPYIPYALPAGRGF